MIDTLNFWISKDDLANGDPFAISSLLSDMTEHNGQKGFYVTGHFKNYIVSCFQWGVTFKGSVAKYKYGNNFSTLTRQKLEEAIDEMCDELGVDVRVGVVSRIDVSTNVITNHPPSMYFQCLGNLSRYKRLNLAVDTLEYRQAKMELSFYDKISQAKRTKMEIPDVYDGENCLRYEMRVMKDVMSYVRTPFKTKVGDVFQEEYYSNLILSWRDKFKKISKSRVMENVVDVKSRPEAKNALFSRLLNSNPDVINEFVQELKSNKCFQDKKEYSRLKSDLEKIKTLPIGKQVDLMDELEKKIEDLARYQR